MKDTRAIVVTSEDSGKSSLVGVVIPPKDMPVQDALDFIKYVRAELIKQAEDGAYDDNDVLDELENHGWASLPCDLIVFD